MYEEEGVEVHACLSELSSKMDMEANLQEIFYLR